MTLSQRIEYESHKLDVVISCHFACAADCVTKDLVRYVRPVIVFELFKTASKFLPDETNLQLLYKFRNNGYGCIVEFVFFF